MAIENFKQGNTSSRCSRKRNRPAYGHTGGVLLKVKQIFVPLFSFTVVFSYFYLSSPLLLFSYCDGFLCHGSCVGIFHWDCTNDVDLFSYNGTELINPVSI
jgi:hypothetical protein